MNILFDQGVPVPLRLHLAGHTVTTTYEQGWSTLANGELLDAAESAGFQVMITTDQNLKRQQRLKGRAVAIVVLMSTSWPRIEKRVDDVSMAVDRVRPGQYVEVPI